MGTVRRWGLRGFVLVCAAACAALMLGSCGAAMTALQEDLKEQVRDAVPSGSQPAATPAPSAPASSSQTPTSNSPSSGVDPSKDISVAQMLQKHNALRSQLGAGPLKADSTLMLVAQRHAAYNASIGSLQHTDA